MSQSKEYKFYNVLKNIFIGAQIEGNSGYVNLMHIKSQYYREFKKQLATDILEKLSKVGDEFEEELYNKLYTFFKKYFSESGSIYFSYTPLQERVYERIYRDDKDVMLFWKTHMLYYVKTERLYQNMDFQDEDNLIWYYFDVSELEHKKNNEKKELVFEYENSFRKDARKIFFKVRYAENGSKTKTEDILKKIKKTTRDFGGYKEEELKRALGIFRKQSEVDYFINKNARAFLREQFSLWIKTYVFDDESVFEEKRLKQLKALRDVAYNIIDLVSQFEDELVKIWNKPKFAHSANYVLTLDKIEEKDFVLLEKILRHKGVSQQIKEWQALEMCNEKFNVSEVIKDKKLSEQWKYLPLDTKHFKKFEYDILALFDDLDNQLDGWLIHSENYQALNTLKGKFREKVQCIYIDPPYNTGDEGFMYLDKYQHSSWLSFIANRLTLSRNFLSKSGSIFISIGDTIKSGITVNSNSKIQILLNQLFGEENFIANFIRRSSSSPKLDTKFISNAHDYVLCYAKDEKNLILNKISADSEKFIQEDKYVEIRGKFSLNKLDRGSIKYSESLDYAIISPDGTEIWPNGTYEDKRWIWRWSKIKVQWGIKNGYIVFKKNRHNIWQVYYKEYEFVNNEGVIRERKNPYHTFIDDIFNEQGNKEIKNFFNERLFEYPKPSNLSKHIFEIGSQKNSLVLDFFGGSGSSVQGVISLNSNDNGSRKYLLIELEKNSFNNVIIPRIKKVSFTDKWKEGKAQDGGKGYSNFFKYYELEQYEESLRNTKYEDKDALPKDIYHQYLFFKDLKLADEVINMDKKSRSIKVDLTQLHSKIDIPETLSFLTGKFIKQILKDKVIFTDDSEIVYANIDYKIIKPLIWW